MPLVQVDLPRSLFDKKGKEIGLEIQQAFVDALAVPPNDKFQVLRPRDVGDLVFDPTYNNVERQNPILIQILMVHMYSVDKKRGLYRAIVTRLANLGIRKEDILIAVTENGFEDWYAGRLHGE